MRPFIRMLAGTALLLAGVSGCGTSGSKLPVTEVTARPDGAGVQHVDVDVHSFYFKPSRIVVQSGKPVEMTLHFKNLVTPHNLTCDHQDAGLTIDKSAGFMSFHRTKQVTFVPTKPGEYNFFCGVDAHAHKGMVGVIVVQ